MFAVVVTFQLKSDARDQFLPLMLENAAVSLQTEKDCHQFDVATDPSRPREVFLYELYSNADAFAQHLASDHFLAFNAATSSMIEQKDVKTYQRVIQ